MDKPNLGGRPSKAQQAENGHVRADDKLEIEMGKLTLDAAKHLKKMMGKIESYKENTQLTLCNTIIKGHKDYMKAMKEDQLSNNPKESPEEIEEDEDFGIAMALTSEDQPTSIN